MIRNRMRSKVNKLEKTWGPQSPGQGSPYTYVSFHDYSQCPAVSGVACHEAKEENVETPYKFVEVGWSSSTGAGKL